MILLFSLSPLGATKVALSIGTWNLPAKNDVVAEATFVQTGFLFSFARRWEVEAFLISEATPQVGHQLLVGSAITLALLGVTDPPPEIVPSYLNLYLSLGFMGRLDSLDSAYGPFIRLSPLAVGGPRFKLRERSLNFSLFYNIPHNSFTIFWNIFLLDFFI